MKKTEISIIVCTYNRAEMLVNALKSLVNQETGEKFSYEIIVIDDKSTDNTKEVVAEISKQSVVPIRYVLGKGNSIASARNEGLKNTSCEWIIFFDDDQLADKNWLKEMFDCAMQKGAWCVGGVRLLDLSSQKLSMLSATGRLLLGEIDHGKEPRKCRRKEFPAAGNIMLKKSIFDVVGKFDDSLIRGGEDIEFAARVRKAGLQAWYTPSAIVYHVTPEYRTKNEYLAWASLRAGENFAHRDYLEWGLPKTMLASLARICQMMIYSPRLVWFHILNNDIKKSGCKYLMLRTSAYLYRTLNLISPQVFSFKKFFARLEFRGERITFQNA